MDRWIDRKILQPVANSCGPISEANLAGLPDRSFYVRVFAGQRLVTHTTQFPFMRSRTGAMLGVGAVSWTDAQRVSGGMNRARI